MRDCLSAVHFSCTGGEEKAKLSPIDDRNRNVILLAAAIIAAPRLPALQDSPALRATVADALRVAKYIARVVGLEPEPVQAPGAGAR